MVGEQHHIDSFKSNVNVGKSSCKNGVFAGDPPVAVASHLFHYLAVDLVLQGVVLGGRAEDLVGQLDRMASVLGGVVTHIPQDGWQEKRLRSN